VSDSLSFKYTLTKGDAVDALRAQAFRSRYLWFLVGLAALFVGYTFYNNIIAVLMGYKTWTSLLRTFLTISAIGVAWWALNRFLPYWTAQRWPEVGVEKEVTVSGNGLSWKSALEDSKLTWANYTSAVETDEFFLLFMGRASFLPIPKRDLAEPLARDRFRDLIRAHVPNFRGQPNR
jgi:dihydrofolate reductase